MAQQKVMKTLNDEYGSMLTFYEDGVLYRQGDTVVGLTGRLPDNVGTSS